MPFAQAASETVKASPSTLSGLPRTFIQVSGCDVFEIPANPYMSKETVYDDSDLER